MGSAERQGRSQVSSSHGTAWPQVPQTPPMPTWPPQLMRAKSSGATITVENLWLFEIADGNFVRAQLCADTAAGRNV
jgi:hypothetical protein